MIGHLKDVLIEKDGEEFTSFELDLTGKLKRLASADASAIAYFYRKGNEGYLNFSPSEDLVAGCRAPHLDGQVIKISEKNEEGEVVTFWDKIYV